MAVRYFPDGGFAVETGALTGCCWAAREINGAMTRSVVGNKVPMSLLLQSMDRQEYIIHKFVLSMDVIRRRMCVAVLVFRRFRLHKCKSAGKRDKAAYMRPITSMNPEL